MVEEYVHIYERLLEIGSGYRGMWDVKMIKKAYRGNERLFEV